MKDKISPFLPSLTWISDTQSAYFLLYRIWYLANAATCLNGVLFPPYLFLCSRSSGLNMLSRWATPLDSVKNGEIKRKRDSRRRAKCKGADGNSLFDMMRPKRPWLATRFFTCNIVGGKPFSKMRCAFWGGRDGWAKKGYEYACCLFFVATFWVGAKMLQIAAIILEDGIREICKFR